MELTFHPLIPHGMKQERPQFPVPFRIGAFHADDDDRAAGREPSLGQTVTESKGHPWEQAMW